MLEKDRAETLCDMVLQMAKRKGASYVDARIVESQDEGISVKDGIVEEIDEGEDCGVGIRVLVNGAWGFSSFPLLTRSKRNLLRMAKQAVEEAIDLARASRSGRTFPLELSPILARADGHHVFRTRYEIDPFQVSIREKTELLLTVDSALRQGSSKLVVREASLGALRVRKFFAQEEGTVRCTIEQETLYTLLNMSAVTAQASETQQRSFGFGKNPKAGYEAILTVDIEREGRRLAEEAEELLSARECPEGIMDVIILPDQLGLHVHETGHGFEGDRLLGYEQTYVGGTFISDIFERIGSYQFGSPHVHIVADATLPNGFGTFGFDDEGVPAQNIYLVRAGILENVLTSREIVPQLNTRLGRAYFAQSNATMRASSFDRMPLIRMTNVSLLPGPEEVDLETLMRRVSRGIILTGSYSWSMSEDRRNFDFGLERGILIENGQPAGIVKNPGYTGDNLKFWKSCDGVAGLREWEVLNVPNCGKGLPGQSMFTGHGSSPALFRNVSVYNRKGRV